MKIILHLILNCHSLPSESTPALVSHCETLPQHWKLTFCCKPGRDAAIAYEAIQRWLPKCRIIAAWSQQELLAGAACGWREPIACWWPIWRGIEGDSQPKVPFESHLWPTWQAVNHLWLNMQRAYDATGKACPVGFVGYEADDSRVEHENCSCVACDYLAGPVMFSQSQGGLLAGCKLVADEKDATKALCRAVKIRQRRKCYQVPVM